MFQELIQSTRRLAEGGPRAGANHLQRLAANNVRVLFLVVRWDVYDRLKLHAKALTYDTLLAIVLLVAVIMVVVKGFGGMEHVADKVQSFIVANLAGSLEMQHAVADY